MRTTINIEDRLLGRLKTEAKKAGVSLTQLANQALELGLQKISPSPSKESRPLRTFALGEPRFDIDKALSLAGTLEDEAVVHKLDLRK